MLRVLVSILYFCSAIGAASAEWIGGSGEDPMTDKQWRAASAGFSPIGFPQVVFKCWEDGSLQLAIIVGRYDDSASYASVVTAKFRVDKQEPVEISLIPSNFNGFLNLSMASEVEPDLVVLLKGILEAKKRVALSVGEAVFQSDVRGATKSIGPMFKVCKLTFPDDEKADDAKSAPGEAAATKD